MPRYAEKTNVPVEKSRADIEKLLRNHGATGFVSGWDDESGRNMLQCRIEGRMLRFNVLRPCRHDFARTETGRSRSDAQVEAALEQEERRRWRAQLLIIKAKLEIIESGMSSIDREFMADLLLPNGATFGEWAEPQLAAAYETGSMPRLLPGGD